MTDYKSKYFKYKTKYLELKKSLSTSGGYFFTPNINEIVMLSILDLNRRQYITRLCRYQADVVKIKGLKSQRENTWTKFSDNSKQPRMFRRYEIKMASLPSGALNNTDLLNTAANWWILNDGNTPTTDSSTYTILDAVYGDIYTGKSDKPFDSKSIYYMDTTNNIITDVQTKENIKLNTRLNK